ncbi:MAG: ABC transporter permease subunit [Nibricoccus sp.]
MKHFLTILSHEIRMLLVNPITYIVAAIFLLIMGFIFTSMMDYYATAAQETTPAVVFFQFFWVPVLFMVPLLTMKSLAEERRLGTLETLLTTPVSTTEVVLGKYFAAYALYISLWASTGGLFYILHRFTPGGKFLDVGPLVGGYIFVTISGLMFVAVGIFASALCRNQAAAGIISLALLFGLIVGTKNITDIQLDPTLQPIKKAFEYVQVFQHLSDFSHGVVDLRQVLFYLSGAVLMLIFSIFTVEVKLLHS